MQNIYDHIGPNVTHNAMFNNTFSIYSSSLTQLHDTLTTTGSLDVSQVHNVSTLLIMTYPRDSASLNLCCLETGVGWSYPQTKLTLLSPICHGHIKEKILFSLRSLGATKSTTLAFQKLPGVCVHIRRVFSAYCISSRVPSLSGKGEEKQ